MVFFTSNLLENLFTVYIYIANSMPSQKHSFLVIGKRGCNTQNPPFGGGASGRGSSFHTKNNKYTMKKLLTCEDFTHIEYL
jgi:hypothetical protein